MFQYLITACVFLLLSREVVPQTTDSVTDAGTDAMVSSLTGSVVTEDAGVTPQAGASSGVSSAGGGGASSGPHSGATSKTPAPATGTGATAANNNNNTTTSSTASKFFCYQGSCNQTNCHKNETTYNSLQKVPCEKEKKCSIKVTQNSTWSLTEFSCYDGQCICGKKVADKEELCCTSSDCNNQKLECSHSSNLGANLIVFVIVFVSFYQLN